LDAVAHIPATRGARVALIAPVAAAVMLLLAGCSSMQRPGAILCPKRGDPCGAGRPQVTAPLRERFADVNGYWISVTNRHDVSIARTNRMLASWYRGRHAPMVPGRLGPFRCEAERLAWFVRARCADAGRVFGWRVSLQSCAVMTLRKWRPKPVHATCHMRSGL
jgi:hypothetical protein